MLIAIEGIDGAGKRTQAELLRDRIRRNDSTVGLISFPRYNETVFSRSIARYLNGEYGPLHSVDPRFVALLYAGDRLESRELIVSSEQSNDFVISDRYVASNYAYQAARIKVDSRWEFIEWLAQIEHEAHKVPKARLTIYLDIPVATSSDLVRRKRA